MSVEFEAIANEGETEEEEDPEDYDYDDASTVSAESAVSDP
jgi:hypothetical protein